MQYIYRLSITRLMLILLVLLAAACTRQTAPQPALKGGTGSPASTGTVVTSAALQKTGLEPTAAAQPSPEDSAARLLPIETLPAVQWSTPPGCSDTSCPQLVIAQEGKISRSSWSAQGLRAAPAAPAGMPEGSPFVIDTGTPSPDGKWAAYTTLSYESGGPVMLQNVSTGKMVNLIEAVNKRLPAGQATLREDLLWDVIGWFPDSTRLMIGPGDLSMVMVVNRKTFAAKIIHFAGSGGGRMFISLDPDGSRFFFVGDDMQGNQVLSAYNLKDGTTTEIQKMPYSEGVVMQPRFSPDGKSVAYIDQKGQPDTGITYALNLVPAGEDNTGTRALAQGNLAMAVPAWSPDGQYIAFTRDDARPTLLSAAEASPEPARGNLWVVSVADGKETQVTNLDGLARSPAWATDGKTLAFVTHDGQVGMASIEQPGQIWQAAGPTGSYPELTSVFFLP